MNLLPFPRRRQALVAAFIALTPFCALGLEKSAKHTAHVISVPAEVKKAFNLSHFYKKYTNANGLPVVGSDKDSDEAILEAAGIVNHLLADREDIRQALIKNGVRVAVMAPTEKTTDIPEHSDLTPKKYWDNRARGLGATLARPAVSCAEENLLNLKGDHYARKNILVHEFAHTIHEMGVNSIDKTFDGKLQTAYKAAIKNGLWKETYAATNHKEYWAEGVQSYFDCNDANNAQHNNINTRAKLEKYDPDLFKLIDDVFRKSKWRYERDENRRPSAAKP